MLKIEIPPRNNQIQLSFFREFLFFGYFAAACSLFVDYLCSFSSDWFQRSGSVMVFVSIVVEFQASNVKGRISIEEKDLRYLMSNDVLRLDFSDTFYCKKIKFLAYMTLALGTLIWGYGDLWFKKPA